MEKTMGVNLRKIYVSLGGNVYLTTDTGYIIKLNRYVEEACIFKDHEGSVIALDADDTNHGLIITGGYNDYTIKAHYTHNGKHVFTFSGHTSNVNVVKLDHTNDFIFSGSNDKTVRKISSTKGQQIWSYVNKDVIYDVAPTLDGGVVVGSSLTVRKIDKDGNLVWEFVHGTSTITSLESITINESEFIYAYESAGKLLKINSLNGNLVWSKETDSGGHSTQILLDSESDSVYIAKRDSILEKLSLDGERLWSVKNLFQIGRSYFLRGLAIDVTGNLFITSDLDKLIQINPELQLRGYRVNR